jgi:hypothetical protein
MQRIDLGSTLTLLLVADPMGEIEQRTKAILERDIAFDLAANVANDASEPGAQEFELDGVGNGGCPGPTRQTELKRPAKKSQSIPATRRTSGCRTLMIFSRDGRNRSS